jgi:hypothetical protein
MTALEPATRFGPPLLGSLDEPVRRFFAHAAPQGAELPAAARLTMRGRIRVGMWLPFTAEEECDALSYTWRARVGLRHVTALEAVDRFSAGRGTMDQRLFGRLAVGHAEGPDISRSAAGRAALEAAIWAPTTLLGEHVTWAADSDHLIRASWDVGPERPDVHILIDDSGAVRTVWADRWSNAGTGPYGYIPCGAEVHAERRFGDWLLPSRVTVGWWFGTERCAPFFRAEVLTAQPSRAWTRDVARA